MDVLLFDLDNTLYPPERELFNLIDVRINRFMVEQVGIPADAVDSLRRAYWAAYGVTLQGLIRHYDVDPEAYLHYVHDVDVTTRLAPDPELRDMLAALPQRKAVFTNGSTCHADRVMNALGITDQFETVFDIRVAGYRPKPYPEPYRAVLAALDTTPQRCAMIEDSRDNLRTAKQLGMTTILVGPGATPAFVDLHLPDVRALGAALSLKEAAP
ncbi:MAG: pyrimidine 5'-nucleotidase [Deltaproteobacteria bacterium]|nr:MAG: pyrimidine 5'-nucleotidase [Deltaproteobacteria bacterium]